jgi:hypothetical protein
MFIVKSNCGTGCRFLVRAAVVISLGLATLAFVPTVTGTLSFAQAQVSESADFRVALEPYGRWERHSRWGEVWIPTKVGRDWRPYTVGRWAYTDDWGWYWVSDQPEDDWGWITFHYGRWVFDRELRWVWVAGREWGPGWVQWRRGTQYVGWAPLPPDEIVVEYRGQPDVWIFVRSRDFVAPRLVSVILPARQQDVFIHETVVVNQTIIRRERGPAVAVNPGIAPAIIAAAVGRPLRTFEVRPRILAGTAQIQGAVEVRPQDLRQGRAQRTQVTVRETKNVIQPSQNVPPAQALAAGERGRLGDNPPRAARQGGREPTTGQGPAGGNQQQQQRQQGQKQPDQARQPGMQGRRPDQPPATEGRGPQQKQPPATEGRGPQPKQPPQTTESRGPQQKQQPPATEGRGPQQKQPPQTTEGRGPQQKQQPQGAEGRGPQQKQQPQGAEGRGPQQKQQPPATEGRGPQQKQQPQGAEGRGPQQKQQPPATEGRGPQQKQQPQGAEGRGPQQKQQPPATEGRGGGKQ